MATPKRLCAIFTAVLCAALVLPVSTFAQASVVGGSFVIYSTPARGTSIAYDPKNDVYLEAHAYGDVGVRFVSPSGTPLAKCVPSGQNYLWLGGANFAHFPRVAYSPDVDGGKGGFLVTWHEHNAPVTNFGGNAVNAKVVSWDSCAISGGIVSGNDQSWWEAGAAVAYSTAAKKFMVVWQTYGLNQVHGQFVTLTGQPASATPIEVSSGTSRDPSVAYNPTTDQFFVAYSGWSPGAWVRGSRVGMDGTIFPAQDIGSSTGTYITDTTYVAPTNRFFVTWYQPGGTYGRLVTASGTPEGVPTLWSSRFAAYDGVSLAYNPISQTAFVVSQDQFTYEDGGFEVTSGGTPRSGFGATSILNGKGNFYPRIAASTNAARWMFTTANNFSTVYGQIIAGTPLCSSSLSSSVFTLSAFGGSSSVNVTTDCTAPWTVSSSASWLTPTPLTGTGNGSVGFTAAPNAGSSNRTATLSFSFGGTVTVTQLGCSISASRSSVVLDRTADGGAVTVTSSCPWTATNSGGWLTTSALSGSAGTSLFSYTAPLNGGVLPRTATIDFSVPGSTATLLITQQGRSLVGGAGQPVFLWQNKSTGELQAWFMSGGTLAADPAPLGPGYIDPVWNLVGRGDFNGDGQADVLFENLSDGQILVWYMAGTQLVGTSMLPRVTDLNWQIVGIGDLNGDTHPDLVWQHQSQGYLNVWYLNGTTLLDAAALTPNQRADASWKVVAVADMDNDSRPDLVFQHFVTGALEVWFMSNRTMLASTAMSSSVPGGDVDWRIVGTGDATGDGRANDVLWMHQTTGALKIWQVAADGVTLDANVAVTPDARGLNWRTTGARFLPRQRKADFDGDGRPDLLLYHPASGSVMTWYMSGSSASASQNLNPDMWSNTNWRPVAMADMNLDGRADIVWQNTADSSVAVWLMNRTVMLDSAFVSPATEGLNWMLAAVYDINGDGFPDLLWQNRVDGTLRAWMMNGLRRTSTVTLAASRSNDPAWRVVGTGDVNGDGKTDLIWFHPTVGLLQAWYMDGTDMLVKINFVDPDYVNPSNWRPVAVGDFNADGKPDLILENPSSNLLAYVLMNGLTQITSDYMIPSAAPAGWWIIGAAK